MKRFVIAAMLMGLMLSCAIVAAKWQPIMCVPHEGPMEDSFEPVSSGDLCDSLEGWRVLAGDQNAKATISQCEGRTPGDKALQISYEFIGKEGHEYVAVEPNLPIDKGSRYIGAWARQEGDGTKLKFRVRDASGETHQGDFGVFGSGEWMFCVGELRNSPGAWAGDGNKKLDFPCTLQAILLDRPGKGYKGRGRLAIDGLSLMRRRQPPKDLIAVSVPEGHFGNVFSPDEEIALHVQRTEAAVNDKVDVEYRVVDFWGIKRCGGEFDLGMDAHILPLGSLGRGYFVCILEAGVNGALAQSVEVRFALLDPPVPLRQVKDSFFAMQTHYRGSSWSFETMPLLARAGMKCMRDEMSWASVEKEKGVFEFAERYDEYVDRARALGIEPMIILDYANCHYDDGNFPASDEAVAGFARYCSEVAKRYRGKIRYFEIWNEWSGGCGMKGKTGNTPENYAKLIAAAYPAVKKANPDAFVIGVGGDHSKNHFDKIEAMFKAGALRYMDAVSVHSYRYPKTPEETDLIAEILAVKKLIEKYGGKQNIWITEIGWPTHIGGRGSTEEHQARVLVRTYVQMLSTKAVDRIFWYDFKDDGLDRFYNESNFGIVRHEKLHCAPKPAYVAYAVMSRLLTEARFEKEERLGDGTLAYRFRRPDGSFLLVAWAPEAECEVGLPGNAVGITDIMGNERKATPEERSAGVRLTGDPLYITFVEQ